MTTKTSVRPASTLPWKAEGVIIKAGSRWLASCPYNQRNGDWDEGFYEEHAQEVAAYIVHACNSYPALVAALRAMVAYEDDEPAIGTKAREILDNSRDLLHSLGETE